MKYIRHHIIFFMLLCSVTCTNAQFPFSKKIDIQDENTNIKGNVLLKDNNGFLWVGTSEGLFKYSAAVPEKISLPFGDALFITALYQDATGTIWAGCRNGFIFSVTNHIPKTLPPKELLPGVAVTAILEDEKQHTWFATAGEGLYVFDGTHLRHVTTADGLGDDNINCLFTPDKKHIIAGTDRGLSFIDLTGSQQHIHFFSSRNGLPDNIVRSMAPCHMANTIWVGTQSKGFLLFNYKVEQIVDSGDAAPWQYGQINDIIELKNETIFATEEDGIICINKKSKATRSCIDHDSSLPRRVEDLQQDNEGNIWAVAENKLISFTGEYLRYFYSAGNIPFLKVHIILADDENKLWFTPDLRLYESNIDQLSKVRPRSFDITPPKDHIDITCLYKDKYGYTWAGTMGAGLFRLNTYTGKWRRILEDSISASGNILNIAGKDDQVWISTLNGVAKFTLNASNYDLDEKIAFTNYSKKDGLGSDYIYYIFIDSRNRVWFATDGAGITLYENNTFTNFAAQGKFPSRVTYSITEDIKHHIRISTYTDGLFEYNQQQFIQYGVKDGLTDIAFTSIAADDFGNIIAVNRKGIDVLNPEKKIVQHFGAESGFTAVQPNLNSIAKDEAGNIWIGTERGIVRYTSLPLFSVYTPTAVFESVLLFNNPVNIITDHQFTADQNNFTFKFEAAYYKAPEKIRFQYWLDGYSKKWETTADRTINFPQLHPGTYMMKIRASASENFDASPVATYTFSISKAFWNTVWFWSAALVLFALMIVLIMRRRILAIRRKDQVERERFRLQYDALKNQVNPHFLFNSFNALMNIVEEDPSAAAPLLKHLSQFYRKMTAYSQKELITLSEELDLLRSYLYIQQVRFGEALQISININPMLEEHSVIPPLVLQLLAENAVKHNTVSKLRPLHINIFSTGANIIVQNNINTKLEKEESEGVGIQNIKNRYAILTGKPVLLEISASQFIVKLPILPNQ
ncbi:MAG: histidine kinase [Bacteroidetes bacterium]|nr:histidine kinase [Bacteroidota bacterium]